MAEFEPHKSCFEEKRQKESYLRSDLLQFEIFFDANPWKRKFILLGQGKESENESHAVWKRAERKQKSYKGPEDCEQVYSKKLKSYDDLGIVYNSYKGSEDWEQVYSYKEEKMLKSYDDWGIVYYSYPSYWFKVYSSYLKSLKSPVTRRNTKNYGTVRLQLSPSRAIPLTPKHVQHLCKKPQPVEEGNTMSREEKRETLAAQGRCLMGTYMTPYCKCQTKCHTPPDSSEIIIPETIPIWLAQQRQCRQTHYFDMDDYIRGGVIPLAPSNDFNGSAEIMTELANSAIHDYNKKECNVFKYKVLKIEKVNCSHGMYTTYWMTVNVLNLTLGTPMETFQIHAAMSYVNGDKVTHCCRPKEEVIIGLPSCDFCFGLLPEKPVMGGKEP